MTFHIRVALLVLAGLVATSRSQAEPSTSFAGQWAASALTTTWSIGDWGDACGPRPSGGGERGGATTIEQVGNELALSGTGRAYSTSLCWEPLPGIQRTSHTAGPSGWRTTCKSPPGDPRLTSLVTTLTVVDKNQLAFDETGQYQFVIKGQNCTASARRTRVLRRIVPGAAAAGASATPLATAVAPQASNSRLAPGAARDTAAKSATSPCAAPGPPARIELRPSHKLIRAGESFTFGVAVVDARGCALGIVPAFRLEGEPSGVSITAAGKVSVDPAAADGEVKVVVAVGARSVAAKLDVVSRERYDAMLAQGGFDPSGASADAAVVRFESGSVGSRSTVLEDESGRRRALFVGIVGASALGLGVIGLALVRRSRRRTETARVELRAPPPAAPARPPMVCPTCRDEYPPEAQFCANDGNRLVVLERGTSVGPAGAVCPVCGQGYDPGVSVCPKHDEPLVPPLVYAARHAAPGPAARKICPMCGAQFGGESQFCGGCGAALVPVN